MLADRPILEGEVPSASRVKYVKTPCFAIIAVILSIQPGTAETYRSVCVDSVTSRNTIDGIRDFVWPFTRGQTVTVHYGNRLKAYRHFYLPSLGSPEAAAKEVERVRDLGFEDVRWIRVDYLFDGDESLQYGVSLGLYENEAAGDKRLAELAAHGIVPSVREGFNIKRTALSVEAWVPSREIPEMVEGWKHEFPKYPPKLDSSIPEGELDCRVESTSPLSLLAS